MVRAIADACDEGSVNGALHSSSHSLICSEPPSHILTLYSHSLEREVPLLCLRPTPSGLPLLCVVTIWLQLWSLSLGVLQGGPGVGSRLQGSGG